MGTTAPPERGWRGKMSDELNALGAIEQLIRFHLCEQEGMNSGQPTPEEWENAVDAAAEAVQTIRAALEAAEPWRWLVTWPNGEEHTVNCENDAELWERGGAKITPLYTAPPSTAEAQARALEELQCSADAIVGIVERIEGMQYGSWFSSTGKRLKDTDEWVRFYNAVSEAKRIREEG